MSILEERMNTPEAKAAFSVAFNRKVKGLTEFQIVDFIMYSKESLWYIQAKRWSQEPPKAAKNGAGQIWKLACQLIVDIVDLGYKDGIWWNYWKDKSKEEVLKDTLILSDFGMMLDQLDQMKLFLRVSLFLLRS